MREVAPLRCINAPEWGKVVGSSRFFLSWEYLAAKVSARVLSRAALVPWCVRAALWLLSASAIPHSLKAGEAQRAGDSHLCTTYICALNWYVMICLLPSFC